MDCHRFYNAINRWFDIYYVISVDAFGETSYKFNAFNMGLKLLPLWISCLDGPMSKWVGKSTCTGFCCFPRNPWPLGNEYHIISCDTSNILYVTELVEGRNKP